jgi:hypothetical protein
MARLLLDADEPFPVHANAKCRSRSIITLEIGWD